MSRGSGRAKLADSYVRLSLHLNPTRTIAVVLVIERKKESRIAGKYTRPDRSSSKLHRSVAQGLLIVYPAVK
jgi:hypothetical protein